MKFIVNGITCQGVNRKYNRDSLYVKQGTAGGSPFIMAIVCDGMGGVFNGEYISAEVVKAFARWSEEALPELLPEELLTAVPLQWSILLENLNKRFFREGTEKGIVTGTTFTGAFFYDENFFIIHAGDSAMYRITDHVRRITPDQTFTGEKIRKGEMTAEEGKKDRRRNMLLQGIGLSVSLNPEIIYEKTEKGIYCLCTDGLIHQGKEEELAMYFSPEKNCTEKDMRKQAEEMMGILKERGEEDNMSVILVYVQ